MKRTILLYLLLLFNYTVSAQQEGTKKCVRLYYKTTSSLVLDSAYMSNKEAIRTIDSLLYTKNINISLVNITSYSCPTGTIESNMEIGNKRTNNIISIFAQNKSNKSFKIVSRKNVYAAWENLSALLNVDSWLPNKKVLAIIRNNENDWMKKKRITTLDKGKTYNYLSEKYFPLLRYTEIWFTISESQIDRGKIEMPKAKPATPQNEILKNEASKEAIKKTNKEANKNASPIANTAENKEQTVTIHPFALKTNLLYDIAGLMNLGVEVPIKDRWSVMGEFNYSMWFSEVKQRSIQSCWGNVEGRYWLGNSTKRASYANKMRGLFVGLYASGGVYDLEWREKGYQGSFYSVGASAGYVYKLSRGFSIENSLNIGFLHTRYDKYNAKFSDTDNQWTLVRDYKGTFNWVGPTMLKVSLTWCPSFTHKKSK